MSGWWRRTPPGAALILILAMAAGGLLAPGSASAALTASLQFSGIVGRTNTAVTDTFPVWGWSWSVAKQPGTTPGWVNLSVSRWMDVNTVGFTKAVCQGLAYSNAVLRVATTNNPGYYRVELSGVRVTSLSLSAGGADDAPSEQLTLSFARIQVEYVLTATDGLYQDLFDGLWDLASNTGQDSTNHTISAALTRAAGDPQATLTWGCQPGRTYIVEFASDPSGPFTPGDTYDAGANTRLSVPVPTDQAHLFFRIQEQ